MTRTAGPLSRRLLLRTASLAPLGGLAGCEFFDNLLDKDKTLKPGTREAVLGDTGIVVSDPSEREPVVIPAPAQIADWPVAGGTPSHVVGNVAVDTSHVAWTRSIGEGGGYREKITAIPIVAGGRVFTMDSDGTVSAFDVASGVRQWSTSTQADDNRSTNVGGGLGSAGGIVYASTGRAEVVAMAAATGKIIWRTPLDAPARSAPTVAQGRVFVLTLDGRAVALQADSGTRAWSYQATTVATSVLGEPAPAYADGVVVCGFGSGELVALRADSGSLAWSDSLAAVRGRTSLLDLSAVRGMPLIENNVVYAVSLGGLMLALDLRSGRRLWERDVSSQNTPWLAGNWIFVLSVQQTLVCLNKTDGHVRWTNPMPRYENTKKQTDPIFWTGPLLGGKFLYLGGSTSKLIAVNPSTGDIVGEQTLPDKISVAPIAAMNRLFVVTDDGTLSAYG
jgi:outer membrane protein assembly factor BamB